MHMYHFIRTVPRGRITPVAGKSQVSRSQYAVERLMHRSSDEEDAARMARLGRSSRRTSRWGEDKTLWPSAKPNFDIFSASKSYMKTTVYDFGVGSRGVPLHPETIYSQPVSCMQSSSDRGC
ncbi:hypothetical protein PR003_g15702 [Phytophthora rubi]|uniref:Uncharacterized protein n=1 Tax=Phytophthora rubi TaxID=129364 RepID=A0A6A4EMM7_9STRA|nr:hypothetical protein PR003_g15702 [Phytophthora rubi]